MLGVKALLTKYRFGFTLVALFTTTFSAAFAGQSVQLSLVPITVNGSAAVDATAINDSGVIVGFEQNVGGFVVEGGVTKALPQVLAACATSPGPYDCRPHPTAINVRGDIVGTYDGKSQDTFLWRKGAYISAYDIPTAPPWCPPPAVGVNNVGTIFYVLSYCEGSYGSFSGTPPAVAQLSIANSLFPVIESLNNKGVVTGNAIVNNVQSLFTFLSGKVTLVAPIHALATFGGFINDRNQVAGAFIDKKGWHGFIFQNSIVHIFDMPQSVASSNGQGGPAIAVRAINNSGRVVGVFSDEKQGLQHVFWYNGKHVFQFGVYPATDTIGLALNNNGKFLISDLSGDSVTSFLGTCSGSGC